jgi:arginase family enzyme
MNRDLMVAFIGVPYDGAATLGWPGARYAPHEVRRQLHWMRMRVQDGHLYWVDEDRVVPFREEQLLDAGDVEVVPHDLLATLEATRAKTRAETAAGRVPAVVGGDDSILLPAVAGFHDAVPGTVGIVHFDAHLDLLDGGPAACQGSRIRSGPAWSSWPGSIVESAASTLGASLGTRRPKIRSRMRSSIRSLRCGPPSSAIICSISGT